MKTLLATANCSHSHSSLAIPCLQAACEAWMPSLPLPRKREYHIRQDAETIARDLAAEQPDLIGFSCYIFNMALIGEVARLLRNLRPGAAILFGGPEMAEGGAELMALPGGPNYVIRGEGERSFVRLLQCLSGEMAGGLESIAGLTWKRDEKVIVNPAAEPIEPLDELPSPFKAGLNDSTKPFTLIEASRGCPFRCVFCLSGGADPLRQFSLDRVFQDIEIIARQGLGEIRFVDRTFNASIPRAVAILRHVERHHPAMRVHVELEPSLLANPELIECLDRKEIHAEIGLQDLSAEALKRAGRKPLDACALAAVRALCRQSEAGIHLDLIAGLPGGTLRGLYENVEVLTEFGPRELQIELLKVLKGTGLRRSTSIVHDAEPPYAVTETSLMTKSDIIEAHLLSRLVDMFHNDRHLGPVVRCSCKLLDAFWPRFLEWWRERNFGSFGVSKMERFERLLAFLLETSRSVNTEMMSENVRKKILGQWVFRRICYSRLRPRRDLDGVEYVEGGKLPLTIAALQRHLGNARQERYGKLAGSWCVWRFECDPQPAHSEDACLPVCYLWIWNNAQRPSESDCFRLASI